MKSALALIAGVIGIVVLMFVLSIMVMGSRAGLAPLIGTWEQRIQTNRGAYRIQSYEEFYRRHNEIAALDQKLSWLIRSSWTYASAQSVRAC